MKYYLFAVGLLLSVFGFSQNPIGYEIKKAEIYLSGGKIFSESSFEISKGNQEVAIGGITNAWKAETVQVKILSGDAQLLSVTPQFSHLDTKDLTTKEKELFHEQTQLNNEMALLNIEIQSIEKEIGVLESYKNQVNMQPAWTPEQYQKMAEYYGNRIVVLKKDIFNRQLAYQKSSERLNKVNAQIALEQRSKDLNQNGLVLAFDSEKAQKVKVQVTYLVSQCGWYPHYDIKAQGKNEPVSINYKGEVWQSTGLDWNQVELVLKTNRPYQNQNRPILNPYYATFQHPNYQSAFDDMEKKAVRMNTLGYIQAEEATASVSTLAPSVIQTAVNFVYILPSKYNVPTDGTKKMLWLEEKEVNARFEYHSVPKLENKVILLGNIEQWNQLNLLSSQASIYFQDTYLGKITIDPSYVGDEFPLSFGVDERIAVQRRKSSFSDKQFIGNKKVEKVTYEITFRNNTNEAIDIDVLDQIPLTNTDEIKLELLEYDGADYNANLGSLNWKLNIAAGTTKKVFFTFEVKYPRDKQLYY